PLVHSRGRLLFALYREAGWRDYAARRTESSSLPLKGVASCVLTSTTSPSHLSASSLSNLSVRTMRSNLTVPRGLAEAAASPDAEDPSAITAEDEAPPGAVAASSSSAGSLRSNVYFRPTSVCS